MPLYRNSLEHPQLLAISADGISLSYAELAEKAQKISGWLKSVHPEKLGRVGIFASRSIEACAGVLGIAWAGGTYVPISHKWPEERLKSVIELSELDALITDAQGARLLSENVRVSCPKHILMPDKIDQLLASPHAPALVGTDDIVYIIYTSGTTGVPKGVMIRAGGVQHLLSVIQDRYHLTHDDRMSENSDLSFDFSVSNMFMAWNAGASLHVIPITQAMAPAKFIQDNKLTIWASVPSIISFMKSMKILLPGSFPTLRYSIFSGEPLSLSAALAWQQAASNSIIDNLWGTTEGTVVCTGQQLTNPPTVTSKREMIAIGKPFPGMDADIIDQNLRFLPNGEEGEFVISSVQVAAGYFKSPELTAARFPVIDGKRWNRTGDLAFKDEARIFHHLGRADNRIKLFGYRIELEEIEVHLRAVSGSELVAAVAWPVANGSASGIVAFISGAEVAFPQIREALKQRLPSYMVPGTIHAISTLPLSINGKVDRKALLKTLDDAAGQ